MSTRIRRLTPADADRLAVIHAEQLPEDFCALLGVRFMQAVFYPALLRVSEVQLGAVDDNDVVQGFAIFSSRSDFFGRLVRSQGLKIIALMNWRSLLRLRFIRYVVEVIVLLGTNDARLKGAEFVYFAVSRQHQGRWVAFRLISQGLAELYALGVRDCWLKTLESTPLNVEIYRRAGFRRLKGYWGRVYMTQRLDSAPAVLG